MPPLPSLHHLLPPLASLSSSRMGTRASILVVVLLVLLSGQGSGSEFPDRECCDSAPPPPPHYHTVTSTSTTTTTTQQPPTYGGGAEQQEKQILNCLLAKQLCEEDSNCSAILKVIPTLCGPELVACSTVTVSRCQAALRTLVKFPWFQPTCLCREPRLDPQCNAFRDLLFDHPCVFVSRKEVDMHPLQYIPTCQLASTICQDNPWCQQRLEMFRATCKFRSGQCRNTDREECMRAWLQLRETPLLGCICPDGKDKKCSRLYSLVNENPCVGEQYPGRVAAMSRVAAALELPLSKAVPVPTAAATHLIISSSQADPLFPLSTIHHYLQHLPVTKTDHNVSLEQLKYLAGTCQSALEDCVAEPGCRSYLHLLNGHCDDTKCHRDACMSSVQDIYKYLLETNQELAIKIALCVCRKRDGQEEEEGCRSAQRRLHPPCAEATDSPSVSQCHNLGRDCRGDRVCRYRLEHYELSCAADTVTGRCAGHHRECTKAMLGLLGTDLHTNCVCKGVAFQDINQCLAWKRLIWGNPCVVEAQLTYHLKRLGFKVDILAPVFMKQDEAERNNQLKEKNFKLAGGLGRGPDDDDDHNHDDDNDIRSDDQNDVNVEADDGTRLQARKVASSAPGDHTPPHAAPAGLTSTTTTTTTTTTTSTSPTTTTIPTTTLPERYCEVRRPWDSRSHIIEEGGSMRLYNEGDQDCSELCFCELHERTKCKVLECLENRPCETSYAVYNHNAPAYQAKRGECVCYSGDFVCQRPKEEEFELPTGLFLLLGFSKTEEALLRNVTGSGAVEALGHLQLLFRSIAADMGEDCLLELLQHTEDNLVLQVRHLQVIPGAANTSHSNYIQMEERDRCEKPAEKVAAMFRSRASRIHHDVSLSLFVLAEVIDNVPNQQRISNGQSSLGGAGVRACWWAWLAGTAVVLAARLEASHHLATAASS